MATPRKRPTDTELKQLFAVPEHALDRSNAKKLDVVRAKLLQAAKDVRDVFPGEEGNLGPIIGGLAATYQHAIDVCHRRAGTERPQPEAVPAEPAQAPTAEEPKKGEPEAPTETAGE